MSCNRGNCFAGIIILTFAFLLGCLDSGFSQTANQYFELGKAELANKSLSAAHTNFQNALSLDPNHEGANFFHAITSILMISNSSKFNALLDRAGVSATGRNIFDWNADFARDAYGNVLLPADTPTGGDLQSFAKNDLLPVIVDSINSLGKVGSSFQTYYNWDFEKGQGSPSGLNTFTTYTNYWNTNEWVGYKLVVEGSEYEIISNTPDVLTVSPNLSLSAGTYEFTIVAPIEIDYGDALVIRGGLNLAKAAILIFSAYNFNVDIDAIVSLIDTAGFNVQTHVIQAYPQLLTLLPTSQMTEAKASVRTAITQLTAAVNFIVNESDSQANDLITISADEGAAFSAALAEWNNALDGPVLINALKTKVDLTQFFDYPKNLRNYLPTFKGTLIKRGSFPDPTFGGIFPVMTATELHRILKDQLVPIGATDFDGDGKPDILWRNAATGANYVWYLDGVTVLRGGSLPTVADQSWKIVGAQDFNNDAKPDVLWRNAATGDNYVWYLDGVTVLGGGSLPTVADQRWKVVGIADFDRDGYVDILWRNTATGDDYVWYLDGVMVIDGGSLPTVADQNWKVVGIADLNNDGKPDVLWRNAATGANYVWYLDGVTVLGGGSLPTVADQNWKVVGIADFNNDDKPDVLWRNAATGDNYVWYLDGVTVLGGGNLPAVADQNWTITPQIY
jgi:hypothetical protein